VAALGATACVPIPSSERASTVVYASGADLQSINPLLTVHPLAKAVQKHVLFVTLAVYDKSLQPIPRLADWSWSQDRRELTLELRPDVMWHDGVATRARDVMWTLEMARTTSVAYPRARDLAGLTDFEATDSLTLVLRFDRPQPVFPDVLTDLAILPAHRFDGLTPSDVRTASFNRTPVGNGPFEFVEYRPNQRWVFRRSNTFPEDLAVPELERFVVVIVDEPATKLAALTSGELDFAGISPAHASFVDKDPRLSAVDYPVQMVYGIVWNLRRRPFDDPLVRRALTQALDRQLIVDAYLYGFGTVANGPVPPEHPWYSPVRPHPFNRDSARTLLEVAGWFEGPDGIRTNGTNRLTVELLTVGSGDASLEQMIQAQWREVGVVATIRQLELASFLARAQSADRDFDALVTGIPGDLSLGYVVAMFEGRDPGPVAYPGYANAEFDAAVQRAREAETETELRKAWAVAQDVLARDHPTSWLYHARGLQGANLRIAGAEIDLRGELAGIAGWRVRGRQ
jgi:peptide/nickel transport system substrate-binding protein